MVNSFLIGTSTDSAAAAAAADPKLLSRESNRMRKKERILFFPYNMYVSYTYVYKNRLPIWKDFWICNNREKNVFFYSSYSFSFSFYCSFCNKDWKKTYFAPPWTRHKKIFNFGLWKKGSEKKMKNSIYNFHLLKQICNWKKVSLR